MIIGIGTDLLLISHIEKSCNTEDRAFFDSVYTASEQEQASKRSKPLLYYATRFAGKEAVYKCFGQISAEIRWHEIEILEGENGKPCVALSGSCLDCARRLGIEDIHISLSFDKEYALAFAVAQGAYPEA